MRPQERGIALIMTLWVLVLLTAVAMSFSFSTRRGSASTRNLKEDTQAYYLSLSSYEHVLAYLLTDPDPTVDYIDEQGNFRTDAERPALAIQNAVEGAEVEVRLSDEESRLNINTLTMEQLLELFKGVGIPVEERQALADSVIDWVDPDDDHHLSGAEKEYYESLGYKPKNMPMDMPEEILLIKGFTREYMYGGEEDIKPLEPIITTRGVGINVNTVPTELLSILGVSEESIASLLVHRAAPGGTKMVPPEMAAFGTTASRSFRIQVVARMSGSPLAVRITSVVRRDFGPKGAVLTTLYWKEDIEGRRT